MLNIVYDVDDVLNNLNEYVFSKVGLALPRRYNIRECNEYTIEQQNEIIRLYGDPETFRNLTYVAGAREICSIEETGKALVYINSSNINKEIADVKKISLLGNIDNLTEERIYLQIGNIGNKKSLSFTDIIIEDCIGNVLGYEARAKRILIDKTYNKAIEYSTDDYEQGIIRVKTLLEANSLVARLVDTL